VDISIFYSQATTIFLLNMRVIQNHSFAMASVKDDLLPQEKKFFFSIWDSIEKTLLSFCQDDTLKFFYDIFL